jgi:carotenoid cleavage dioxygenase-like enzyme
VARSTTCCPGIDATTGSPIAFNGDVDRFVVCLPGDGRGSRVVVIRRDGGVFGHDVTMTPGYQFRVGNAFASQGSPVAFNGDDDRFVVTMDHRIVVIRRDGNVWGHEVSGTDSPARRSCVAGPD